jgi:hypothetical protein
LDHVVLSAHTYPGEETVPLHVWLDFGGTLFQLAVDASGEGLEVTSKPIGEGFDMAQYGEVVTKDVSGEQPFTAVVGEVLRASRDVRVADQLKPVGVMLRFHADGQLFIANWGDELILEADYPPYVLSESPTES